MDQTSMARPLDSPSKGGWAQFSGPNPISLSTTWLPGSSTNETTNQVPTLDSPQQRKTKLEERMKRQHMHQLSFEMGTSNQKAFHALAKSDFLTEVGGTQNTKVSRLKERFESSRAGDSLARTGDQKSANQSVVRPKSKAETSPKLHLGPTAHTRMISTDLFGLSQPAQRSFDSRQGYLVSGATGKQSVGIGSNNIKVLEELQKQRTMPLQKLGLKEPVQLRLSKAQRQKIVYFKELSPKSASKKGSVSFSQPPGRTVLRTTQRVAGAGSPPVNDDVKDFSRYSHQQNLLREIQQSKAAAVELLDGSPFARGSSHEYPRGDSNLHQLGQEDAFNLNYLPAEQSYTPQKWMPDKHYTQRIPKGLFRMKEQQEPESLLRLSDTAIGSSGTNPGGSGRSTGLKIVYGTQRQDKESSKYGQIGNFKGHYAAALEPSLVSQGEPRQRIEFIAAAPDTVSNLASLEQTNISTNDQLGNSDASSWAMQPVSSRGEGHFSVGTSQNAQKKVQEVQTQYPKSPGLVTSHLLRKGANPGTAIDRRISNPESWGQSAHNPRAHNGSNPHVDLGQIPSNWLLASPHPRDTLQGYIEQQIKHGLARKPSKNPGPGDLSIGRPPAGISVREGKVFVNLGVLVNKVSGPKHANGGNKEGKIVSEQKSEGVAVGQPEYVVNPEGHRKHSKHPALIVFQPQPGNNKVMAGEEIMIIRDMMLAKLARQRGKSNRMRIAEGSSEIQALPSNPNTTAGASMRKEVADAVVILGQNGERIPRFLKIKKAELQENTQNRNAYNSHLRAESLKQEWADLRLQQPIDVVPRKVPVPRKKDLVLLPEVQQSNPTLGSHHKSPTANFALPVASSNSAASEDKEYRIKVFQSFVESIALSNTEHLRDYYPQETLASLCHLFPVLPHKPSVNYKYTAFVGRGNNEGIVQEALRRRWWWGFGSGATGDSEDSFDLSDNNLVWTQLMVPSYHQTIQKSNRECSMKMQGCHYTLDQFLAFVAITYETSVHERVRKILGTNKGAAAFHYLNKIATLESLLPILKVYLNLVGSSVNLDACQLEKVAVPQKSGSVEPGKDGQETGPKKQPKPRSVSPPRIHNHILANAELGDKMNLFFNLANMYVFADTLTSTPSSKTADLPKYGFLAEDVRQCPLKYSPQKEGNKLPKLFEWIPLTFVVKGMNDPALRNFQNVCEKIQTKAASGDNTADGLPIKILPSTNDPLPDSLTTATLPAKCRNIWILKPGENSNRGRGISVAKDLPSVMAFVKQSGKNPVIIQKYIENPLLYKGRKFDMRMYCLITWVYGSAKLYFYDEGYVRTSSFPFDLDTTDTFVHLTNEAVQIKGNDFGKFEKGNKVSLENLNAYIKSLNPEKDFYKDILPKMKVAIAANPRSTLGCVSWRPPPT